ncbi:MAG TPA: peroxidase, partial [Kribbella sp.]|nr:peroxidase [Kribbella sp.]
NHDRILDFSTAITGNLFFVPAADFLENPSQSVAPAATPAAATTRPGRPSSTDGSLGIGSLRRSRT